MKKLLPLLIITFVSSTAHAQYFKNATYLNSYTSLDPFFSYDSMQSIYQSDTLELYRYNIYFKHKLANFITYKIKDSSIYFQLNSKTDSTFYMLYDLKLKKNDSFFAYFFDWQPYLFFPNSKTYVDSAEFVVGDTSTVYSNNLPFRRTQLLNKNNLKLFYFYDSLLIFQRMHIYKPETLGVCVNNNLIYSIRFINPNENLCEKDIFFKNYSSLHSFKNNLSFKTMPNPAHGTFEIVADNPLGFNFQNIQLFNNIGVCVLEQTIDPFEPQLRFDISHLSPGIYTLLLSSEEQVVVDRLVIE